MIYKEIRFRTANNTSYTIIDAQKMEPVKGSVQQNVTKTIRKPKGPLKASADQANGSLTSIKIGQRQLLTVAKEHKETEE